MESCLSKLETSTECPEPRLVLSTVYVSNTPTRILFGRQKLSVIVGSTFRAAKRR